MTWNNVPAGNYVITARALDNGGASTTSNAINITVNPAATPVPRDGLASVSYDSTTNRINTTGWEYDAAGNQTRLQRADGTWQRHVYDWAGRLVKVQNDSGITQIIHTYGASNHRLIEQVGIERSNQRTYYAWAGDSVIAEYTESDANATTPHWSKSYVYLGGRLLATIAPSGASERVEYQHADRLGTRLVTNNQDTTSFEQAALPFGRALDAESTGSTKRRFTSYDRSTVSGLDYAVNRHYDPLQGRFTQVDPIGMASVDLQNPQMLNLYAYCANDPINQTDPSGLGFWSFLGKVFSFFAKVAKWIAIVVAVVVIVAVALQVGFGIQFLPVLVDVLSNLGILSLAGAGPLSFAAGGAAGVGIGGTGIVIAGLGAVGAVNSFMQKKPVGKGPDPAKVKRDFYGLYEDILNGCIKQVFGKDARRVPKQTLKNAPAIDNRLTGHQIGVLSNGGAPSGYNDPSKGRYGTVYLAKEYYLSKEPYAMEWIWGAFAHELGNILDTRLNPKRPGQDNYGNQNDPWDTDTGAALHRCVFGGIRYPDGSMH